MPSARSHGPSGRSNVGDVQTHFSNAAGSLTALYKLAHEARTGQHGAETARDQVRRFANMAAVEMPAAGERHRGRRFVALDELEAFLANEDAAGAASPPLHTFGRKRGVPARPRSVDVPPRSVHDGLDADVAPPVHRHRAQEAFEAASAAAEQRRPAAEPATAREEEVR